ncbi:MAG: hypothetical protein IPN36_11345 [Bacteroidetes bacterium]|nr:hypothetical protein [Bacteroidota bacterium]MBL0098360.1 hypothetical protein [Bacteroidota bacterium]
MLNELNEYLDQKREEENDDKNILGLVNEEYYLINAIGDDNTNPGTLSIYFKSKDANIPPVRWNMEDEFFPINIDAIPYLISRMTRIANLDKNYLNYK